jgi:hypothetical protein
MALPAQNYMSSNSRTEGEMKVALEDQRDALAATPGGAPSVELTIAASVVTPAVTAGDFRIDTEADAAADDLTNILQTNSWETRRIRLRCENAARVTTLKHAAGGSGQILTVDGADFALNDTGRWIDLEDVGSDWVERARGYDDNWPALHDFLRIAAVPAHNLLCPHSRLRVDYATAATVTIAADAVVLADSSGRLKRFNSLSETLNIANTGANGRDVVDNAGAEQASVWYHRWAIGKDDGTLDVFATQACYPGSATSIYTRLPSGYTWAGYLGAEYNDGSSNLVQGYQRGTLQHRQPTAVLSGGTAASLTSVSLAAAVPHTALEVIGDAYELSTSGSGAGNFTLAPAADGIGQINFFSPVTSVGNGTGGPFTLPLRGQTLHYFRSGNVAITINVTGWRY